MPNKLKLEIYNKRVLQVLEEMKGTSTQKEAFESIGCNPRNASKYVNGEVGFTVDQIISLCKKTGVSADWILGISATKYVKEVKTDDPIKLIERALEQLKGRK